jgi:hypothetical protein
MTGRYANPVVISDQMTVHQGESMAVLGRLPSGSVDACITSPLEDDAWRGSQPRARCMSAA